MFNSETAAIDLHFQPPLTKHGRSLCQRHAFHIWHTYQRLRLCRLLLGVEHHLTAFGQHSAGAGHLVSNRSTAVAAIRKHRKAKRFHLLAGLPQRLARGIRQSDHLRHLGIGGFHS